MTDLPDSNLKVIFQKAKETLDAFVCTSLHDATKLQPNALNFEIFKDAAAASTLNEQELRNVWSLFEQSISVKDRLVAALPEAAELFDVWEATPLKSFSLTSLGIAIGHANATRMVGFNAPLNIWIK